MNVRWSRVVLPMGSEFWGRGVEFPWGIALAQCLANRLLWHWPNVDIRWGLDMDHFYAFSQGELVGEIGSWIERRRAYIRRQYRLRGLPPPPPALSKRKFPKPPGLTAAELGRLLKRKVRRMGDSSGRQES